jgi:hypothetical protein
MNYEKQKAKELVDKMLIGFIDWTYHVPTEINDNHTILSEAKKRALILVDEIINNVYKTPFRFTSESADELYRIEQECKRSLNHNILFLNLVKKEINKL